MPAEVPVTDPGARRDDPPHTSAPSACPRCGHDRTGLGDRVCPECGASRWTRGGSSRLWTVGLCGMVLAYALLAAAILSHALWGNVFWALVLPLPLADGPRRVRRWLRTRRAFAHLRRDQRQLAAAAWCLASCLALAELLLSTLGPNRWGRPCVNSNSSPNCSPTAMFCAPSAVTTCAASR